MFEVRSAVRFQIQNEDEKGTANESRQEGVSRDAECRAEIRANPSEQAVRTPHHQRDDQGKEDRAQQANRVGKWRRELGPALDLLLLLLEGHLRRAGALFDLLAHEFAPVDSLVDRKAYSTDENRGHHEREDPAGFSDNVFKSLSRRK